MYLVANTIMNVTTQDKQVAVFVNASAHLDLGGFLVVEVIVPQLRQVPPGVRGRVFALAPDHVGVETFDDLVGQVAWSYHWNEVGGRLVHHSAPFRYAWPSALDLMVRLGGFRLRERLAGWDRSPFTVHVGEPEGGDRVREREITSPAVRTLMSRVSSRPLTTSPTYGPLSATVWRRRRTLA